MQNLAEQVEAGALHASINAVIASNPAAKGIARAEALKLPTYVVPRKRYASPAEFSDVVFRLIDDAGVDLICLAGFLSLLVIPDRWAGRMINIHPALLPAFGGQGMYGHHVHEAVLAGGCKISGCTVHFADQTYDTGPILVQRTCPVLEGDTPDSLAARVNAQERVAYPQAIRMIADGRVELTPADPDDPASRPSVRITPPGDGAGLVERALELTVTAHAGQTRKHGTPYAEHPIAVASTLSELGIDDPHVLAAAYLHDVVEDTATTVELIRSSFGDRVAGLVAELTLPPEAETDFDKKHATLAGHARQMSAHAKLIKLADRRHNLAQIGFKPPAKRLRYAEATLGLLDAMSPIPPAAEPLAAEVRRLAEPHTEAT